MENGHGECLRDEADIEVVQAVELHEETHSPKVKRFVILLAFLVPREIAKA